ncbi:hypothetical protein B0A81_05320 [Flavobacterium plurextorum]|uniref:Uncharacterized protein n=1 Tax=Flavobacterium plurextorum TaxID=1114867 RepID=A0ABX4CWV7_9FLAO|nr:hypothetical protein [Flavobacterium plurextorum]OXB09553.1 hypothetical protein B0A81_05320 [Flavobacterium plurextorum]
MKNNRKEFKELPKNIKFATHNSNNEDFIIIEYFIANLIYNGASFKQLLEPAHDIKNKKDKEQMITETTNIVLDFIKLNPEFAKILKQNKKVDGINNFGGN